AVAALKASGLEHIIAGSNAVATSQFALHDPMQSVMLQVPEGYALSRKLLDAAIVQAAIRSGAQFLPSTVASVRQSTENAATVRLKSGEKEFDCHASIVVVADGLNGRALADNDEFDFTVEPQSKFGAGVIIKEQVSAIAPGIIYMACTNDGYVGMVRMQEEQINVAAALRTGFSRRAGSAGQAAASILQSCRLPVPRSLTQTVWHGTELLTRTRKKVSGQRIFVIGDASGYAEPITGEGMSWAMWSALSIFEFVMEGTSKWTSELGMRWQSIHNNVIRKRQQKTKLIASAIGNPILRSIALCFLRISPAIADPYLKGLRQDSVRSEFEHMHLPGTSHGALRTEESCQRTF
ncbi:MAG: NAD(P)/FAD-dependent oxidoreductase, partial [Terriglobales bacterium]